MYPSFDSLKTLAAHPEDMKFRGQSIELGLSSINVLKYRLFVIKLDLKVGDAQFALFSG
jgi:hypothetical protein